jgi:hypothetical protein
MKASGKIGSNGVDVSDNVEKSFETYIYIYIYIYIYDAVLSEIQYITAKIRKLKVRKVNFAL